MKTIKATQSKIRTFLLFTLLLILVVFTILLWESRNMGEVKTWFLAFCSIKGMLLSFFIGHVMVKYGEEAQ